MNYIISDYDIDEIYNLLNNGNKDEIIQYLGFIVDNKSIQKGDTKGL